MYSGYLLRFEPEDKPEKHEEYVYTIGEQFHVNAPPIIAEKMKLGVCFRAIFPEAIVPPPGFRPAAAGVERRTLLSVKIIVFMTEKEAIFARAPA